jgi:predicted RNase H-like HicB family nuclease
MTQHYIAIIEQQPGTLYGGWFPDLPGAASAGPTMDACFASAIASLRLWAAEAGDTMPAPRAMEAIHTDPDVIAAKARGGVLVAVPRL